MLLLAVKAEFN